MSHHHDTRAEHCYKNLLHRLTPAAMQKLEKCKSNIEAQLSFAKSRHIDQLKEELIEMEAGFGERLLAGYMEILNNPLEDAFQETAACAVHGGNCDLPHANNCAAKNLRQHRCEDCALRPLERHARTCLPSALSSAFW